MSLLAVFFISTHLPLKFPQCQNSLDYIKTRSNARNVEPSCGKEVTIKHSEKDVSFMRQGWKERKFIMMGVY